MSASLYSIEQLQAQLVPVFQKNGVRKAILFGSYAKGTAQPASDVDLWVDSGLRGLSFFGLLEDVCRCVQCEVDLIDRADVIPGSAVDREIHNTGVVIYEQ